MYSLLFPLSDSIAVIHSRIKLIKCKLVNIAFRRELCIRLLICTSSFSFLNWVYKCLPALEKKKLICKLYA